MNREDLRSVLKLFSTKVLTEDQTIDIILGNTPRGKPRGDIDVSDDPVRALVVKQLDQKGLTMKEVSLELGRAHSYLYQFLKRGIPRKLHEDIRPKLAKLLGVSEDQLRG